MDILILFHGRHECGLLHQRIGFFNFIWRETRMWIITQRELDFFIYLTGDTNVDYYTKELDILILFDGRHECGLIWDRHNLFKGEIYIQRLAVLEREA